MNSHPLARRDPLLAELDAMTDSFERMFGLRAAPGGSRGFLPPVDIWEDEQTVVIELDVPGCSPENLSAEAVDGQLVGVHLRGDGGAVAQLVRIVRVEDEQPVDRRRRMRQVVPREVRGFQVRELAREDLLRGERPQMMFA